jgi:hypothetical protein
MSSERPNNFKKKVQSVKTDNIKVYQSIKNDSQPNNKSIDNKTVNTKITERVNRFNKPNDDKRAITADNRANKENHQTSKSVRNKSSMKITYCPRMHNEKVLKKVISFNLVSIFEKY